MANDPTPRRISAISSREAVVETMREYDKLGRDGFLGAYGYGPAKRYVVRYEGRIYDSKALIGVAYGRQFPDDGPLRNDEFTGGDATVRRKLESLGFDVTDLRGARKVRYWWVNQGASFRRAREEGFLWAPLTQRGGGRTSYWEVMGEVEAGDAVVHYVEGSIRAISRAAGPARRSPRPEWEDVERDSEGERVDVEMADVDPPIQLADIPVEWRTEERGPFQVAGGVRQGYLFELSEGFFDRLAGVDPVPLTP